MQGLSRYMLKRRDLMSTQTSCSLTPVTIVQLAIKYFVGVWEIDAEAKEAYI
jgi:hypothetical protein